MQLPDVVFVWIRYKQSPDQPVCYGPYGKSLIENLEPLDVGRKVLAAKVRQAGEFDILDSGIFKPTWEEVE